MVPVSHLLWSQLWLGIATDAFDRARAFVRAAARRAPGEPVPAAVKLSHVMTQLSLMRGEVNSALDEFLSADEDRERLSTMAFASSVGNGGRRSWSWDRSPAVCSPRRSARVDKAVEVHLATRSAETLSTAEVGDRIVGLL